MKTNFLPQLQMNPLLAAAAGGQALLGLGQALFSGKRKAIKEMEALSKQSPTYSGGGSIMDYYNKALQRASTGLTDTAAYKTQMQNLAAGTSQGINALQDRRGALSSVGALIAGQNRGQQNAVVNAEQEQSRRFNTLGSASQMKTGEETKRYQYNQLNPYLRRFQLAQQKAASAANTQQTGWSNLYGAATTFAGGQSTDKGSSNINNSLSDPNSLSRLQVNNNLNKYATRQVNPLTSLKAGNSFLIK